MANVKTIDRKTIDKWPIAASGLPLRVVNSLAHVGLATVGELRALTGRQMRQARGLGPVSAAAVHRFFRLCGQIEAGVQPFPGLKAIFRFFLTPEEQETLALRYGLREKQVSPAGRCATLQQVGQKQGRTRERVRQMESEARERLGQRLAQACLRDMYRCFEEFITLHHGAALPAEIATLKDLPFLDGYHPVHVLRLLCDCGASPVEYHGFFTSLPLPQIARAEGRAVVFLIAMADPQPLSRVLDALAEAAPSRDPETCRCIMDRILRHAPGVSATADGRYFAGQQAMSRFVREIMARRSLPVHFRAIVREFNALVQPESRISEGRMLDILMKGAEFRRTASGLYEILP
jgi:hypothetical protein